MLNWTENFKISDETKQLWEKDSETPKLSFLAWCLRTQKINEIDYLKWASQTYSLPIVKKEFFSQPTIEKTWTVGKFLHQWTTELLPLEEWDGLMRVACLEPHPELKLAQPFCFVLAPASELQKTWSRFFPAATSTPSAVITSEAPQEYNPADLLQHVEEPVAEDSEAPETAEEAAPLPDGFVFNSGDIDIPIPTFVSNRASATTDTPKAALMADTPKADLSADTPSANFAAEVPPTSKPASRPALGDFAQCQNLEQLAFSAFENMKQHFSHSMLLLSSNDTVTPLFWSENFKPQAPSPTSISTQTPSVFRIVTSTNLPFHGNPKPCTINNAFFNEWLGGSSPLHLTAVPILVDGRCQALFLGCSRDENLNARQALSDMETWCQQLTPTFTKLNQDRKKTAA